MDNTVKNTNRTRKLYPPWKKGVAPNPKGRGKGIKNFSTLFREALISLGKLNGKDPDVMELDIVRKGVLRAHRGDYKFYKDTFDRVYGTAVQRSELTGKDGQDLFSPEEKQKSKSALKKFLGGE